VKWKIIMQLRDHSIEFYKTEQGPRKNREELL
jgi:hypothetical protein